MSEQLPPVTDVMPAPAQPAVEQGFTEKYFTPEVKHRAMIAAYTAALFLVLSYDGVYMFTNKLGEAMGMKTYDFSGPTMFGLALHAVVFALVCYYLFDKGCEGQPWSCQKRLYIAGGAAVLFLVIGSNAVTSKIKSLSRRESVSYGETDLLGMFTPTLVYFIVAYLAQWANYRFGTPLNYY